MRIHPLCATPEKREYCEQISFRYVLGYGPSHKPDLLGFHLNVSQRVSPKNRHVSRIRLTQKLSSKIASK